jgi:hypothetical protein
MGMIKHLKIHIALFICTSFIFRIVAVNIAIAPPLHAQNSNRLIKPHLSTIMKRRNHFDVSDHSKNHPLHAEAIVESTEDNTNVLLVKDPECSSSLVAVFHYFKSLPNTSGLRNLVEHSPIKQSNRTYLSISVLRI